MQCIKATKKTTHNCKILWIESFLSGVQKKNEAIKRAAIIRGFKLPWGSLNTVVDKAVTYIQLQNSQKAWR